jgi:hypothetical protein
VAASARGLSRVQEATLCYLPFFEAAAIRLGTVFVRDRVKRPPPLTDGEQGGQALDRWLDDPGEEREDTKVVEQDVLRVGPACELPELGVGRIPLAELRRGKAPVALAPFDAVSACSRATVFAPTIPAERFLEETTWRVRSANDDTRYVEMRLKLLYYPVWLLRYRNRGRVYELAVDGVRGTLLRGAAPTNTAAWEALAAAGLGVGALGLGRWLLGAGGAGGLFLLAGLCGAALAWLAARRMARTAEVELGGE